MTGTPTPYLVGFALALLVCAFARIVRLDRDGAFYSTVLVVTASYYVLFAVMGGSMFAVAVESVVMTAFVAMAVAGFKVTPWLVIAGIALHGVFDVFHGHHWEIFMVPERLVGFEIDGCGDISWV